MTGARPLRAIQQVQIGTVCNTARQTDRTLRQLVEAGYEGIELNGFMVRRTPALVRGLTRLAGMPTGRGGHLDWAGLVDDSGLRVVALHEDLGTIEKDPHAVVAQAERFATRVIVVTGMYRFDYTSQVDVSRLAERLNASGERLARSGLRLLYHNHNVEWRRLPSGRTAFAELVDRTDPTVVGFEFDAYWPTAIGVDALSVMRTLGRRLELLHLTDRGTRRHGRSLTPIDSAGPVELGDGTMDVPALIAQAVSCSAGAVILETHRDWVGGSPVASFQRSAAVLRIHLPTVQEAS